MTRRADLAAYVAPIFVSADEGAAVRFRGCFKLIAGYSNGRMMMDTKTRIALKQSIAKWEANAAVARPDDAKIGAA
jgi:hypothetical protein